jgi:hypothetical protein
MSTFLKHGNDWINLAHVVMVREQKTKGKTKSCLVTLSKGKELKLTGEDMERLLALLRPEEHGAFRKEDIDAAFDCKGEPLFPEEHRSNETK